MLIMPINATRIEPLTEWQPNFHCKVTIKAIVVGCQICFFSLTTNKAKSCAKQIFLTHLSNVMTFNYICDILVLKPSNFEGTLHIIVKLYCLNNKVALPKVSYLINLVLAHMEGLDIRLWFH